jgi:acetylornithine/succinyldiaminopimelate/putrescine aminotransferase
MIFGQKKKPSSLKRQAIKEFRNHVSPGKVSFFKKYGMDFVMGRREGCYLWDIDGKKKLFNLHCNGGVFNLGHRNLELIELLKKSLDEFDIGNHHLLSRVRAELAAQIAGLMPGDLEYTVFGVSGGEAVDLALKVATGYTGKKKIISARGGYHGHTGLAVAAGDEKYRLPFGLSDSNFIQVPFNDIETLETVVDIDTAAIILETIPATLGMVIPGQDYLRDVRDLCDREGVLLIMDEVQTGLGRTGKLWGFEHFGIVPDMVILGKGLSGGLYPISATVMRKPLETIFHEDPFIHISTFGGAEPGCIVAKRVLEISSSAAFLEQVNLLAARFSEGVEALREKHPAFLAGLRQLGLMMGLKLCDRLSGPVLTKAAYDKGLLLIYANNDTSVCQFLPPLVMEAGQVDQVLDKLDEALKSARWLKPVVKLKRKIGKIFK